MTDSSNTTIQPPTETHDLGRALGMLVRSYHDQVTAAVGDMPHGYRGYQVLATVMHGDHPNQLAIATHLGIDRTVMTYVIDDLVNANLVERQPDPNDRRARRIVATPEGRRIFEALEQRVHAAETMLLGCLSASDQVTFRNMLCRVATLAGTLSPESDSCTVIAHLLGDDNEPSR